MAQQARPIGMGQSEFLRIQLMEASSVVITTLPSTFELYETSRPWTILGNLRPWRKRGKSEFAENRECAVTGLLAAQRRLKFAMNQKGFVAVFERDLAQADIAECVVSWLKRFEKVEQVIPGMEGTLEVKEAGEIMWEPNLQFRVLNGDQFAWVYVSVDRRAMETTGFQDAEISLCLDVLLELPGLAEVVDEKNQRRLDELERAGII